MRYSYGWQKDHLDVRDWRYRPRFGAASLPRHFDQRTSGRWPSVYDQSQLGSCMGQATGGVFHYARARAGLVDAASLNDPAQTPSRLFIYRHARVLEGTVTDDAGSEIRDGVKTLATKGVCFEDLWPYDIARFRACPPQPCWALAYHHTTRSYRRVDNTDLIALKSALFADDPIAFGCDVYPEFQDVGANGFVTMPRSGASPDGGHAMVLCGFDDDIRIEVERGAFLVRNSWGTAWGMAGYCWMPYAYLLDSGRASDFWVIDQAA